jgi:flavin-dependent dehydrogenase
MIDRTQFPRDKLCGDTLNPGTLSILDRLRLSDRIRRRALPITGMRVTGPRAQVSETYPDNVHGVALKRRELDSMLLEAAVAAGVTFESGTNARTPYSKPAPRG